MTWQFDYVFVFGDYYFALASMQNMLNFITENKPNKEREFLKSFLAEVKENIELFYNCPKNDLKEEYIEKILLFITKRKIDNKEALDKASAYKDIYYINKNKTKEWEKVEHDIIEPIITVLKNTAHRVFNKESGVIYEDEKIFESIYLYYNKFSMGTSDQKAIVKKYVDLICNAKVFYDINNGMLVDDIYDDSANSTNAGKYMDGILGSSQENSVKKMGTKLKNI